MSQGGIQGGTLSGPRTAGPAFLFCGKRGRGHRELPAGGAPEPPRAQVAGRRKCGDAPEPGRAGGRRTRGGARGGLALGSRGSEIPSGHRASATARNPPGKPGRGREPGGGGGQDPGLAESRPCPEGWGRGEQSGRFPSSARPRGGPGASRPLPSAGGRRVPERRAGAESGVRPPRVRAARPGFSQLAPRGLGASGVCGPRDVGASPGWLFSTFLCP